MNNMRKLITILILPLTLACQKSEYKTVDFDAFEITVPSNWKKHKIKGIDSYVSGLITDKNDTLIFDLGWYSTDLTKNTEILVYDEKEYSQLTDRQKERLKGTKHLIVKDYETIKYDARYYLKYKYVIDSIDCFKVKFIKPTNKGFGASGIYIDSLKGDGANSNKTRLSFYGNNLSDSTQIEFFKVLKSIKMTMYCE